MDLKEIAVQKNDKSEYRKVTVIAIAFFSTFLMGLFLLGNDYEFVIRFWAAILLLGISVLPMTLFLFKNFKSTGYIFSKIIGLILCGYLIWLLSSIHFVKFQTITCILAVVLIAGINYLTLALNKKGSAFCNRIKEKWFCILVLEVVFLFILILFIFLFGHKIIGTETEKSMDYALMSILSRTKYMPPNDMWAAGNTLNYYYFGQYLFTYLTKISFIDVLYGYSLSMAVIPTFCFLLVTTLVYEIMREELDKRENSSKKASIIASLLSGLAVTLAGNMHYIIFGKMVPMIWDILQIPGEKPTYWFASSTRYIGYVPNVENDKTISEFPSYSFLVGDLHAHVIDIIVVLTILALLFSYMKGNRERSKAGLMEDMFRPHLLLIAFLIGICSMTSYWDFPIYYVISGSIVLFSNLIKYGIKKKAFFTTIGQGVIIFCIIKMVSLPFNLKFNAMINGIGICKTHSAFYQLVILWGFPVIMLFYFLYINRKKLNNMCESDLFIILIGLCAVGLIIMPEIIYVRDIYEDGFPRANTMFKLTYAAFILFGITLGYIIAKLIFYSDNVKQKRMGIIGGICLVLTTLYFFQAAKMYYGDYLTKRNYQGIDATLHYKESMPDDMNAIKWLQDYVKDDSVVLEADGDSYTDYQRVSVLTGLPTVLGWHTHEWLWNNSRIIVDEREADITELYTGSSMEEKYSIIKKYNIQYIFIGTKEYEKYIDMDVMRLKDLGDVVFSEYHSESEKSTVIIKVN